MIRYIQSTWHSQNSLFKYFQGYLRIFRDIDAYLVTLTVAQLGWRGRPPLPFFWKLKKVQWFSKKSPYSVHFWFKFSIQNVVLGVSRRKNSKIFPCGIYFSCVLMKCLSKCPSSSKPSMLWDISGCVHVLRHCSFCKTLHLKCLTVFFWILCCLDNCSVICTVTLKLWKPSDSFRILAYSEFCVLMYTQVHSSILRIIKAYSRMLRHFQRIYRFIQAYLEPWVTHAYLQTCHNLSPGIFRSGGKFKTLWNFDQAHS